MVSNMGRMFLGCSSLQTLDLSKFDTTFVRNMSSMFNACNNLQTLDISGFEIPFVKTMTDMFKDCDLLQTIKFPKDEKYRQKLIDVIDDCRSI